MLLSLARLYSPQAIGGDLNLNGNSIINVSKIIGTWGKWQIDENGKLIVKKVETENLLVKKQAAFGTTDSPRSKRPSLLRRLRKILGRR